MPFETVIISPNNPNHLCMSDAGEELKERYSAMVLSRFKHSYPDSCKHYLTVLRLEADAQPIAFQYFYVYKSRRNSRIECEMWALYVQDSEEIRKKGNAIKLIREAANRAYTDDTKIYIFRFSMEDQEIKNKLIARVNELQRNEFPDCKFVDASYQPLTIPRLISETVSREFKELR